MKTGSVTVAVAGLVASVYLTGALVEYGGLGVLAGYAVLARHFGLLGYVIVSFFATWTLAWAVWRFGNFDHRYSPASR
jgi:high-affinity nickel-transport protein